MEQQCKQQPVTDESEQQFAELMLQGRMREIGLKLLVLSGKGGVGKSTVAANLAHGLAKAGKKVGLLDVDIHGPSIPKLMGVEEAQISTNGTTLHPVKVNENLYIMSIGFMLPNKSDPVIWRGPMKYSVIRQFLQDVDWGRLDYLVIDSPPGTGDEPLSVAQLVGSPASAIIVTTPQDLAISDVRRCISFCKSLSLPVLGVIENMSGFVCPKCGVQIDVFKTGGGEKLAADTQVPFLGKIPINPEIVNLSDAGKSFINTDVQSSIGQVFSDMITKILLPEKKLDKI